MANDKDFKVKNGIKPTVYHEAVGTVVSGTVGYAVSNASYDSVSFSVASQELNPMGLFFKSDGTKMFVTGLSGDDINEYALSTAWDISSASFTANTSVSSQATGPTGLFFKSDGTIAYICCEDNNAVYQYTLSTAWDISTLSYASKSFSITSQETSAGDLYFKDDGTKMYIIGSSSDKVHQYSLSTAYDVSTASYDSASLDVSSYTTQPEGLFFSSNGKQVIVGGHDGGVDKYTLTTAWDISTASYSVTFDSTSQTTEVKGVAFKDDGTKMYLIGTNGDTIYQYSTSQTTATLDLSTGAVFDYNPTSDVQVTVSNPAASGTVSSATLLLTGGASEGGVLASGTYTGNSFDYSGTATNVQGIKIDNSGAALYILSLTGDIVYQFSLSTSYNVSTASYDSKSFDTSTQASSARSLEFSSDGTKMYVGDQGTAAIYQYTLSTAFDVSTASYASKSLSISSQDAQFREVRFNADGTSLYVYGDTNVRIYQYNLTTAWDISTASYASKFMSPSTQTTAVRSFDLSEDGTKLFVFSYSNTQGLFQYTLSTAGDISTASYDSVNYTGYATEVVNNAQGFDVENSDVSLYINDPTATTIFQYTIANGATITYDTTLEWAGGTAPTSPAIGETDVITISTRDGGTTYQAIQAIDGAK